MTRKERSALTKRTLSRPTRNAVSPVIEHSSSIGQSQAIGRLPCEEVEGICEVHQAGERADGARNRTRKHVVGNVQLLQAHHPPNAVGQRPNELIEARIEDRQVLQLPDFRRQAGREIVVEHDDLIQSPSHLANAGRQASPQVIVGKDDDRDRRVPQIGWDLEMEPVVVDKYSIQVLVEELGRQPPFKLIEPDVQILQQGQ
jgi:hypothetical protein